MHILHVVGARPNFMKVAPVYHALARRRGVRQTVLHTGQHYDFNMSDVFFQELGLGAPDINLEVGSGSHAQQTGQIISRFEPAVLEQKPDLVRRSIAANTCTSSRYTRRARRTVASSRPSARQLPGET